MPGLSIVPGYAPHSLMTMRWPYLRPLVSPLSPPAVGSLFPRKPIESPPGPLSPSTPPGNPSGPALNDRLAEGDCGPKSVVARKAQPVLLSDSTKPAAATAGPRRSRSKILPLVRPDFIMNQSPCIVASTSRPWGERKSILRSSQRGTMSLRCQGPDDDSCAELIRHDAPIRHSASYRGSHLHVTSGRPAQNLARGRRGSGTPAPPRCSSAGRWWRPAHFGLAGTGFRVP